MRRLVLALLVSTSTAALAASPSTTATLRLIDPEGIGKPIGQVTFEETRWGLLITPDLKGLPPGLHGFHLHEKGDCGPGEKDGKVEAGLAAGGHFDPDGTKRHRGPYREDGHRGDLPVLPVDEGGRSKTPLLAPRLKLADLQGRALMVHAGGDNYDDSPQPLGGGAGRIACGVVQAE